MACKGHEPDWTDARVSRDANDKNAISLEVPCQHCEAYAFVEQVVVDVDADDWDQTEEEATPFQYDHPKHQGEEAA